MKLAVAVLLVCVAIPHACGFSFPSFDTNEAFERIREAGKEIVEKARGHADEIQETVQKKKEELEELRPTQSVQEMWRQIKEKAGNHEEQWQQRKKQMKEMWKEMKQRAGESGEELKKMWKEHKGTWRNQAEEKWQKYKRMTAEQLELANQEIEALKEKLGNWETGLPKRPWKEVKDVRSDIKAMITSLKDALKVKLRKLTTGEEEEEVESTEEPFTEELNTEEPFTEGLNTEEPFTEELNTEEPDTEGPFTEELLTTILPNTPEEIPSSEFPSMTPTEYIEEGLDGNENWSSYEDKEVLNDEEKQTPDESEEEEDDEEEVLPEEPVQEEDDGEDAASEGEEGADGNNEEESQPQEIALAKKGKKILQRFMERRNRKLPQWLKRGKAMKNKLRNLFKGKGRNTERQD